MKGIAFLPGFIVSLLLSGFNSPAFCEVLSDNTTNTTVNQNDNNFNILNGIQKGNNLFHSFKEFSIPNGGSVTFKNPSAIVNIINRVTGGNISNIDGLIQTQGSANLFLINPNGIVFGENASLNIGGSFLATTAESILFKDGFNYSAIVLDQTPLLTVSIPLGLQMGKQSGAIEVNGTGHNLIPATHISPIKRSRNNINLNIPGKTLALVGGKIKLHGGILTTESGKIELAALGEGLVKFDIKNQELTLNYAGLSNFEDIQFLQKSLVAASGKNAGSIQVQGANVNITDGSKIWIQNRGLQQSGNININADESLIVSGNTSDDNITSGLTIETLAQGNSGDINIFGRKLLVENGARISNNTYSSGTSGDINLKLLDSVKIFGLSPIDKRSSVINTSTLRVGNSGAVNLSTTELTILNGGIISSSTLGSGNAGYVTINATDNIEAIGISPLLQQSSISSFSTGTGNAGNLIVNTKKLVTKDGGRVDSSTFFSGGAGSVTINASESVEVSGQAKGSRNPSLIISSANILDEVIRKRFGLPEKPFGASGNVEINTPNLTINNGGLISVRNDGFGDGGKLQINANSIHLDTKGGMTAATESGKGGDIKLNLQNSLVMGSNSLINTESLGIGNGGNININSQIIFGFENSDIIANAVEGMGGNINIKTQGIFGLKFRNQLTSKSDITASSKLGVNGTVKINNIGLDPSSGLIELSTELTDASQQIVTGCTNKASSSFVITGRGGIPQNPNRYLISNQSWYDIRDISIPRKLEVVNIYDKPAIVEATGFIRNSKGEIELAAFANKPFNTKKISDCSRINT
ncbi:MAG: filamentous hemagglutinin N-terminal domain-containing protein [Rivularia sp. ALOHA_DT_140]|nr:filamentous hemagglutinin N-terminal domain-containing protein [Rivularia sp. ALOHA_DT_140]